MLSAGPVLCGTHCIKPVVLYCMVLNLVSHLGREEEVKVVPEFKKEISRHSISKRNLDIEFERDGSIGFGSILSDGHKHTHNTHN